MESLVKFASPNDWRAGIKSTWDLLDGENDIPIDLFIQKTQGKPLQCPGVAYEIDTTGLFTAPDGEGNYIIAIDDVIAYVGYTTNLLKRVATSKVILFASLRPRFSMYWVPHGNRETEHILRMYLYPEWNSTELRSFRPFHDCGCTLGSGWPKCTLRYYSTLHKDRRSLFTLAG